MRQCHGKVSARLISVIGNKRTSDRPIPWTAPSGSTTPCARAQSTSTAVRPESLVDTPADPSFGRIDSAADHQDDHDDSKRPYPDYLSGSPTQLLLDAVDNKSRPLTYQTWRHLRLAAVSSSPRLPVVLLQHILRKRETQQRTSLSDLLDDDAWKVQLNGLAFKGIRALDVEGWAWIMEEPDADKRIQRFVTAPGHKPIFLLLLLVRRNSQLKQANSLAKILEYVSHTYLLDATGGWHTRVAKGVQRRTLNQPLNMTWQTFLTLSERLIAQALRLLPEALVTIAHLAASYISSIPPNMTGYATRCHIYNRMLCMLRKPATHQPLQKMHNNYEAQRILLSFSTTLERPLLINRESYRAMRAVMLGLKKSEAEREAAEILSPKWPPYLRARDGIDERREASASQSRNIKALMLQRQDGYGDEAADRTLSILGGGLPEESPFVQTRSLVPSTTQQQAGSSGNSIYAEWAARVRATRNAHEAWQQFTINKHPTVKPNHAVYAELFDKLFARTANNTTTQARPGDGTEVLPVYDVNLSEYEKARISPPTADDLYQNMLRDGNRPVQRCLCILVRNARDLTQCRQYLQDTGLAKDVIRALFEAGKADAKWLQKVPNDVLSAFVHLLCELQPRDIHRSHDKYDSLAHAERILDIDASDTKRSRSRAPRLKIIDTLTDSLLTLSPVNGVMENKIKVLRMILDNIAKYEASFGVNLTNFDALARCLGKTVDTMSQHSTYPRYGAEPQEVSTTSPSSSSSSSSRRDLDKVIIDAHIELKNKFAELCMPIAPAKVQDTPAATTIASAAAATTGRGQTLAQAPLYTSTMYRESTTYQIRNYILTLAHLGDFDEMALVIQWVLRAWRDESSTKSTSATSTSDYRPARQHLNLARDPRHGQHAVMIQALAAFRVASETFGSSRSEVTESIKEEMEKLCQECDFPWEWPTDEDVDLHLRRHPKGLWAFLW